MLLSSWNWKIFYAAHVVSQGHTWTGAEKVLDVGCGHGLMLISAARYLSKEAGITFLRSSLLTVFIVYRFVYMSEC